MAKKLKYRNDKGNAGKITAMDFLKGVARLPRLLVGTMLGRLLLLTLAVGTMALYTPAVAPNLVRWSWSFLMLPLALGIVLSAVMAKPGLWNSRSYWRKAGAGFLAALALSTLTTAFAMAWANAQLLGLPVAGRIAEALGFWPFAYQAGGGAGSLALIIFGVVRALLIASLAVLLLDRQRFMTGLNAFGVAMLLGGIALWFPFKRLHGWRTTRAKNASLRATREAANSAAEFHSVGASSSGASSAGLGGGAGLGAIGSAGRATSSVSSVSSSSAGGGGVLGRFKRLSGSGGDADVGGSDAANFPWHLPPAKMMAPPVPFAISQEELDNGRKQVEEVVSAAIKRGNAVVPESDAGPQASFHRVELSRMSTTGTKDVTMTSEIRAALEAAALPMEPVVVGDILGGVSIRNSVSSRVSLSQVVSGSKRFAALIEASRIPVAFGVAQPLRPVAYDLARMRNLLINGESDAERSQCLQTIMLNIMMYRSPGQVRMAIMGPRDGALTGLPATPYLYGSAATKSRDCAALISSLSRHMREHLDGRGRSGGSATVVFIEDLDALLPLMGRSSLEDLERVIKWGGEVGICVVASCNLTANSRIPQGLRSAFHSRVCFKVSSGEDSMGFMETPSGAQLQGQGEMLFWPEGQAKPLKVQCVEPQPSEMGDVLTFWADSFAPTMGQLPPAHEHDLPNESVEIMRVNAERVAETAHSAPPPLTSRPIINARDAAPAPTPAEMIPPPASPPYQPPTPAAAPAAEPSRSPAPPPAPAPAAAPAPVPPAKPTPTPPPPAARPSIVPSLESAPDPAPAPAAEAAPAPPPPPPPPPSSWRLPSIDLIGPAPDVGVDREQIERVSSTITSCMAQHGVEVSVERVFTGPTVTTYGLRPGWRSGRKEERVRVDHILKLEKDLALALGTANIRFENVVPGVAAIGSGSLIGIEVPNGKLAQLTLRSVMDTPEWREFEPGAALPVPLALGSGGTPVFADLANMPHALIAGSTGSGKSVCINALINGILLTRTPAQARLMLIDPKRVELTQYDGVPHLYSPVIVEPKHAVRAFKAMVQEMEERLRTLQDAGVRSIADYNARVAEESRMPYLLMVVDELADLMLTSANEVENLLKRLAQLGRATGIHLVVATQRPSVDVVTGMIKVNFPTRISFALTSQADSRTILGDNGGTGGEKLLGKGDMLFLPGDSSRPRRMQGVFLSDAEIDSVIRSWKAQPSEGLRMLEVDLSEEEEARDSGGEGGGGSGGGDGEDLLERAAELAETQKTLSITFLQRKLGVGYPRAARLMDDLEDIGVVGPADGGKARAVLISTH